MNHKTVRRQQRQQRLQGNRLYRVMSGVTKYMDRYYLDALIGLVPGVGDVFAVLSVLPFVYFSFFVVRSVPLTLAVLNNAFRDVALGMLPFFVGDAIDFFYRANQKNMALLEGFVEGDAQVVNTVNRKAWQAALVLLLLLVIIVLLFWLLYWLLGQLF